MLSIQPIPVMLKGEQIVRCHRCGRSLTNPRSRERGYGPVCWQKIHVEFGFMEVPKLSPALPLQRVSRNIGQIKPIATVHRTLDEFLFVDVIPTETVPMEPLLATIHAPERPITTGGVA